MKWIEEALDILYNIPETTVKTTVKKKRKRIRPNPRLEQLILELVKDPDRGINEHLSEVLGITLRTAQRYSRTLFKLRWLAKDGWHNYFFLNPFLELLVYLYPIKIKKIVSRFASLQVDLLDLFALLLQLALRDKVSNVDIIWSQFYPDFGKRYFPNNAYFLSNARFKPYWNGIVQIEIEGNNKMHYAILPYNIHWTGRNCHITLPIPFKFYGIEKATYSKSEIKIHFDNSITTTIPLGSASWTTRKRFHQIGREHWSDMFARFMKKYWKNEYAECYDFTTHEQNLRDRLVNKKYPSNQQLMKDLILQQFLKG